MADQPDNKKDKQRASVRKAVQKVASTEAGVIFFRWMKGRCHFEYTTLSGDPQSHEVNPIVSVSREYERRLYLDTRQAFTEEQKFKIEVQQDKTEQKQD